MIRAVVGIDCATNDSKLGLALGMLDGPTLTLGSASLCGPDNSAVDTIERWVATSAHPVLLAIDAPLGWPQQLSQALLHHVAGASINVEANLMFRRATDAFIKKTLRKTPLDVGADRIARTAHAALRLLAELRKRLNQPIPLAWVADEVMSISAIEVYPAATLLAHGLRASGYKKPEQIEPRLDIVRRMRTHMTFLDSVGDLSRSADLVDAALCVLAGADFLRGSAMPPEDKTLAVSEGWIWTARPLNLTGP